MSIFSKNTLLVAILWGLSLSAFAQRVPSGLKATYKKFDRIRLDWQATLAKGESITIKRTYKKNKKEILERNWTDTTPTFIDDLNLKEGDYIYQICKVAANGKQSEWSNQAIGAISVIALKTPKIYASDAEFSDHIEITYEQSLRESYTIEIERRGRDMNVDKSVSKITFTQSFEPVKLESWLQSKWHTKEDDISRPTNMSEVEVRLVDKNVDERIGAYQYRIRVVDKNGNESAWSAPVVKFLKRE